MEFLERGTDRDSFRQDFWYSLLVWVVFGFGLKYVAVSDWPSFYSMCRVFLLFMYACMPCVFNSNVCNQ